MTTLPTVPETLNGTPFASDIFSNLLQHNILFLNGPVTQDSASLICSSLLYLSSKDETQPISLYINSPGGDITAGLPIQHLSGHLCRNHRQNKEKIRQDLNYRDFHMSSEEAVSYELIDRIQNKLY